MSVQLGQTVIIENMPGAGGTIGSQAVARAEPDGYTLLLGWHQLERHYASLYKNLNYNSIKDFAAPAPDIHP